MTIILFEKTVLEMEKPVSKCRSVYTSKPAACIHTDKFMGMDFKSIDVSDLPPQLNKERLFPISKHFLHTNFVSMLSYAGSELLKILKWCADV